MTHYRSNPSALTEQQQAVKGSINDVAREQGRDVAELLAEVEVIIMVDSSSSMDTRDGGSYYDQNTPSRYDRAREALATIQAQHPGKVLIITFQAGMIGSAATTRFCLDGIPSRPAGMTPMHEAFQLAKPFAGTGVEIIVVSDGQPDSEEATLQEASFFRTERISTIYIGDGVAGEVFMKKLAGLGGGISAGKVTPDLLTGAMQKLLPPPSGGAIQL